MNWASLFKNYNLFLNLKKIFEFLWMNDQGHFIIPRIKWIESIWNRNTSCASHILAWPFLMKLQKCKRKGNNYFFVFKGKYESELNLAWVKWNFVEKVTQSALSFYFEKDCGTEQFSFRKNIFEIFFWVEFFKLNTYHKIIFCW